MALPLETLRAEGLAEAWRGLSTDDVTLLATWVQGLSVRPEEIHTSIPVGRLPELPANLREDRWRRFQQHTCSWRVDAAVRFGPSWWVLECKPDAGHMALGQVVFYRFWWRRMTGYPDVDRWVILTDECDGDFPPVCESYGIDVVRLGEVLEYSRRKRRRVYEV